MKVVKITAGMTMEFEVISTDAPMDIIEEQLTVNSARQDEGMEISNPYDIIEEYGYVVNILGCQDDFDNDIAIDEEYDYYDY